MIEDDLVNVFEEPIPEPDNSIGDVFVVSMDSVTDKVVEPVDDSADIAVVPMDSVTDKVVELVEDSADIGTRKITNINKVAIDSVWVNGKPWMSGDECNFPVKTVGELCLSNEDRNEITREETPLCNAGPSYLSRVSVSDYAVDWSAPERITKVYEFSKYIIAPIVSDLAKSFAF